MHGFETIERKVIVDLKCAYQEKADAQLAEWQIRIEKLKSNANSTEERQPVERERTVQRLEDCYRIARVRLDELRASQDEHWEIAKQAVERAMIDLKRALDESGSGQAGRFLRLQTSRSHVYDPFPKKRG